MIYYFKFFTLIVLMSILAFCSVCIPAHLSSKDMFPAGLGELILVMIVAPSIIPYSIWLSKDFLNEKK